MKLNIVICIKIGQKLKNLKKLKCGLLKIKFFKHKKRRFCSKPFSSPAIPMPHYQSSLTGLVVSVIRCDWPARLCRSKTMRTVIDDRRAQTSEFTLVLIHCYTAAHDTTQQDQPKNAPAASLYVSAL